MFMTLFRRSAKGGGLPKTGQVFSYFPGDDGYYQKGLPQFGARFAGNGNGTVKDKATGLIWIMDPSLIGDFIWGYPGSPNRMLWQDAVHNTEGLSYGGYTDWRLPNIHELMSIIEYSLSNPSVDGHAFPYTQLDSYWSSTTVSERTDCVWGVDFKDGSCLKLKKEGEQFFVRPVRGGW